MAAKLQCEICGGKLIGKPGGIFECDSCGVEYSTEWAKMKIQEIRGTVTVEGTVEVTGKVQVDGPVKVDSSANKDALLQRGVLALEVNDWKKATIYFDQALNMDAQCAEAYLGLALAEYQCCNREMFSDKYTAVESKLRQSTNVLRAKQFGDEILLEWFNGLDEKGNQADKKDLDERNQSKKHLAIIRKKIEPASKMIAAGPYGLKVDGTIVDAKRIAKGWRDLVAIANGDHLIGLKADGTVVADTFSQAFSDWTDITAITAEKYGYIGIKSDGNVLISWRSKEISNWKSITAVALGFEYAVGLKTDGTVLTDGKNSFRRLDVNNWTEIVAIAAGSFHTVGLRIDGTVVAVGKNDYHQCEVSTWRSIVAIAAADDFTVGLRADGTVVAIGQNNFKQCNVNDWTDIVAIKANFNGTLGLKSDGTVVATDDFQQNIVANWKLFNNYETIENEREAAFEEAKRRDEEARRRDEEKKNRELAVKNKLQREALLKRREELITEKEYLPSLFAGKRRAEILSELVKIDTELKKLQ